MVHVSHHEFMIVDWSFTGLLVCFRFVPDREFAGTDRSSRREGPVQFEREEEEDPFGLDTFLKSAKTAEKRPAEDSRRDHKRRKD